MAVYTDVTDDQLGEFLGQYDIGEAISFKGIAEGVENSNYLLETTKERFILTLYEKRVDPDDLPFFLSLMDHLSHQNITCPLPVENRLGQSLGILASRPAAIFTFLTGMSVKRPKPGHCRALGEAMAAFHLAGKKFDQQRINALSLEGWKKIYQDCNHQLDHISTGLDKLISEELQELEELWPDQLPRGVIHADLFPDNVFFLGDHLSGLIDFYFACTDMLAYDMAIAMNAWCFEPDNSFNITKARNLLRGYQTIRPIENNEINALPILCRGAALRFLLTRSYDWLHTSKEALVRPKDPMDYVQKLRFHQTSKSALAYGIE